MNDLYVLDESGEKPVRCDNLLAWAFWFERSPLRRVSLTVLDDRVFISTVFLGIDHGFDETKAPVIWETMVFTDGSDREQDIDRCAGTREQSEAMHDAMVKKWEDHKIPA